MSEQPGDNRRTQVSGQIVPDQDQAEWWQWQVWDMPQPGRPVRRRREFGTVAGQFLQDLEYFLLQPGVQDGHSALWAHPSPAPRPWPDGTGSATWPYRHGCTRAGVGVACPQAPRI